MGASRVPKAQGVTKRGTQEERGPEEVQKGVTQGRDGERGYKRRRHKGSVKRHRTYKRRYNREEGGRTKG